MSSIDDDAIAEGVGVARRLQSIDTRLGLSLSPSSSECTEEGLAVLLAIAMGYSQTGTQKISSGVVVSSVYAESSVVQSNRPYSNLSVCVQRREIHERDTVKRNRSSRAKTPMDTDDSITPGSFVTPPVVPNHQLQQHEYEQHQAHFNPARDSSASDLELLDNTAEDFDDQITPGLITPLAGSNAPITADIRRHSTEKAMLEATLTNLRSKLSDVEKDDWLFEGPRYSHA